MDTKLEPQTPVPQETSSRGERKPLPRWVWSGRIAPAFWTVAAVLSLIVNVILIGILLSLAANLGGLKLMLDKQLIGGLYDNFVLMDQASIRANIPVTDFVQAKFDLVLDTDTNVVLSADTFISNARVTLNTGGLTIINAPTDIVLPAGTVLPIHLSLIVPVDQQIPVNLNVAVDIPLNQTDLHTPFVGLQNVLGPYKVLLADFPGSFRELLCGPKPSGLCAFLTQ
ncbi:MAG TPA: hypothetical protein VFF78_01660 [Anaerolineaceae bacterium]|nr:hypothetical protein [Anaerolineaceae bacterium]